jgi:hypothetical protein
MGWGLRAVSLHLCPCASLRVSLSLPRCWFLKNPLGLSPSPSTLSLLSLRVHLSPCAPLLRRCARHRMLPCLVKQRYRWWDRGGGGAIHGPARVMREAQETDRHRDDDRCGGGWGGQGGSGEGRRVRRKGEIQSCTAPHERARGPRTRRTHVMTPHQEREVQPTTTKHKEEKEEKTQRKRSESSNRQ